MNLKICPVCRSLYPEDFTKCDKCDEELIDNEVYKKWNDNQRNKYMKKYKSKYNSNSSSVTISKASMPVQSALKTSLTNQQANIPKCPICQSTSLSKISTTHKAGKIALFGIFGAGDIGKTWKCNNCGSKF